MRKSGCTILLIEKFHVIVLMSTIITHWFSCEVLHGRWETTGPATVIPADYWIFNRPTSWINAHFPGTYKNIHVVRFIIFAEQSMRCGSHFESAHSWSDMGVWWFRVSLPPHHYSRHMGATGSQITENSFQRIVQSSHYKNIKTHQQWTAMQKALQRQNAIMWSNVGVSYYSDCSRQAVGSA